MSQDYDLYNQICGFQIPVYLTEEIMDLKV